MSSTNRGRSRNISDYYITPEEEINKFLDSFLGDSDYCKDFDVLDPCAGGDSNHLMAYPNALLKRGFKNITTIDVRPDSKADIKGDFLQLELQKSYDFIITNPPFYIAEEVIKKAMKNVVDGGWVIMLLRLNFMGSQNRRDFWLKYPPLGIYIHSKRMCFTGDGKTDSIEYAHFVWRKMERENKNECYIYWL